MPLDESRFIKKGNPSLYDISEDVTEKQSADMAAQEALAYAGMVPGFTGMGADLLSAALYAKEGDWKNTLWSLASFLPIVGMAAGAKRISKAAKPWMQKITKGEKSPIMKLKSYGKSKDDAGVIEKLWRRKDLSTEGRTALRNLRTKYDNYMNSDIKSSRRARLNRQGGNQSHESIRKADWEVEKEIKEGLDDIVAKENNTFLEGEYDLWVGKAAEKKVKYGKLTEAEKELIREVKLEESLFREGQAGFTEGGARIK